MSEDLALDRFPGEYEGGVELPRTELPESGQGKFSGNKIGAAYVDGGFDDFELQKERLAGYDQIYIKTSTAPFHGRFTSAYLENGISVDLEYVNSGMHQHVGCPEDGIGLSVSLGPPGTVVNGVEVDQNKLILTRPGSELNVDVMPEGGRFLLLSVRRSAVEAMVSEDSRLGDFVRERGQASIVNALCTAEGFTGGVQSLLKFCGQLQGQGLPGSMVANLLAVIVEALELEVENSAVNGRQHCRPYRQSYATFAQARDALTTMEEFDYAALTAATGLSPRAIQLAFAQYGSTTPHRYFRILKLHRARNALRAGPGDCKATIGDIAAAHGFWSPSRFTQMYRQLFGELPSETRARA
ncbi:MAG: AraC family transcriptional regulator [Rhodospirillaceae bacterium]|nr:AraC family transcriptional regulator [Rhodospirillaceae bacterium]